jgi:signal transduction histidine kinase
VRELDAGASGCTPDDDSLSEAISCLAGWCEEQTGIEVGLKLERLPESQLSSGERGTIVRIIQEALRNVHQHATASRVLIWADSNGGR